MASGTLPGPPPFPPPPPPEYQLRPEMQPPPGRPASRGGGEPHLQVPGGRTLRTQRSMPELSQRQPGYDMSFSPAPAATFGPGVTHGEKNMVQSALSDARHFASGLIPHPIESTKHYSILRHSAPLIWYRGPSTSVAITIFSSPDHPLPPDRTLWLQSRGFSGDTGMKIKAFFNATDGWLHVTPATQVQPNQVDQDTERGWQRDIAKAAKKLVKEKGPKKAHVPRETHVIRIPEASDDGYFRLILCTGKGTPHGGPTAETSNKCKTLCTSPIFRVASASSDSSVFRGASLTTLPLEMGVFVGSRIATSTVERYVAPVRAPIDAVVDRIRPGFVAATVGGMVRDGLSERSAERDAERDETFFAAHQAHVARARRQADPNAVFPIGPDAGPEAPFPIKFQGQVVRGTGRSEAELGFPTANLSGVPDGVRYRLNGVYFGWACVLPLRAKGDATGSRSQPTNTPPQAPNWHKSIITITPNPYSPPSVAPKPLVTIHLLSHPPGSNLLDTTLKVLVLGLLRPPPPLTLSPKACLDAISHDICLTLVSLAQERENWQAESVRREASSPVLTNKTNQLHGADVMVFQLEVPDAVSQCFGAMGLLKFQELRIRPQDGIRGANAAQAGVGFRRGDGGSIKVPAATSPLDLVSPLKTQQVELEIGDSSALRVSGAQTWNPSSVFTLFHADHWNKVAVKIWGTEHHAVSCMSLGITPISAPMPNKCRNLTFGSDPALAIHTTTLQQCHRQNDQHRGRS
ncbi:hypothetical protein VTJ49DRAFT_724 [Mycothermus thermophilus]|uniref:Riboflavin kinase n=1 Tax=Humicola insolens TaxID=85995 RepID=A0ABR3VEC2_HUMIN